MITVAKIFAVLGIIAYATGCYGVAVITMFGNSPSWRTDLGAYWHVGTALAAIVFCIVAVAKARKKPGEAAVWLLASAGSWVLGQLGHVGFLAIERPAPDFLTGLKGYGGAVRMAGFGRPLTPASSEQRPRRPSGFMPIPCAAHLAAVYRSPQLSRASLMLTATRYRTSQVSALRSGPLTVMALIAVLLFSAHVLCCL